MKRAKLLLLTILFSFTLSIGLVPLTKAQTTGISGRSQRNLALVTERIRRSLVTLPYYSVFDNLYFKYDGDTVVLGGEVVRPVTRKDAENAVRKIEGVENVVNKIEVLPLSSFDDQIRANAYRRIFSNPQFTRYAVQAVPPIHIIVKQGHVKLEGVVANEADKIMAGTIANQLDGVFSVENNLRVEKR